MAGSGARRWLRDTLVKFPDDLLGDVLLVCTELVSNAYDHARGPRDVRVAITIHAGAGEAAGVLQRSSRQVARAVRAALAED